MRSGSDDENSITLFNCFRMMFEKQFFLRAILKRFIVIEIEKLKLCGEMKWLKMFLLLIKVEKLNFVNIFNFFVL